MEPTTGAGLIRVLLALSCATLALAGGYFPSKKGRGGGQHQQQQQVKMPPITRTWHMTSVSDCSLERCQQICEEHYGATKLDVTGRCDGDGCNCEYREPCRQMPCYQSCLRTKRGKLNLKANCIRHECFCKWDNHCIASTCEALCLRDHKGKEGVRGLCVGEDCSCRWN
ncbi:uncharacterized protein [Dermacentor albipictus]|uniref:uncharacterized protein n=1 Tax=Dermacentor albipictus TaxID=60249 RepID=UPI0031FC15D0